MDEPLEGVEANPGPPGPDTSWAAADNPAGPATGRPAMRAAQLWKLLGDDVGAAARPEPEARAGEADTAAPISPATAKSWADDELGELLARAWYETVEGEPTSEPAAAVPDDWSHPSTWEVERLPSASEGGVAALFGDVPKAPPVADSPPAVDMPEPAPEPEPGMGRVMLAEMLEHLPSEPLPRVTPADIHLDPLVVAPVALWFWGDDDIYPGRVPSAGTVRTTTTPAQKTPKRAGGIKRKRSKGPDAAE